MSAKKKAAKPADADAEVVHSVKGFDRNMRCRGFQFEVGQTYEHKGLVEACASGFHACEHPLNVFEYYPPATSRYAAVVQSGKLARHTDTKIASAKITIEAELSLAQVIERAVKWVFDRAKWAEGPVATGDNEGATASGWSGAATASGRYGAATASGDHSSAIATAWGKVRADRDGCALFLTRRDDEGAITHAWAGISGRDGIKSGVWYSLEADGRPVEC